MYYWGSSTRGCAVEPCAYRPVLGLQGMAITSVESAWIQLPLKAPRGLSGGPITASTDAVCRVTTTDGVEGIGEARGSDLSVICQIVDEVLRPLLLGLDESEVEALWSRMHHALLGPGVLRPARWTYRAVLAAIGMVDQALWDIRARRAGAPVCVALGGARRAVPAYLSEGFYIEGQSREEMVDEAQAGLERLGFRALKVRIGRGIRDSVARIRCLRERLGEALVLMADANQAWDLTTALAALRRLDQYNLTWLEEPIKPHGGTYRLHDGHDANADTGCLAGRTRTPIATGENHVDYEECRDVVERGGAKYMQFDAIKNGGVTEWTRVARLCAEHAVAMAPHHVPHFHVHLASAVEHGAWVECFDYEKQHPAWPDLFPGFPPVVDGTMTPPDAPGWGMTISDEFLAKHGTLVRWRH